MRADLLRFVLLIREDTIFFLLLLIEECNLFIYFLNIHACIGRYFLSGVLVVTIPTYVIRSTDYVHDIVSTSEHEYFSFLFVKRNDSARYLIKISVSPFLYFFLLPFALISTPDGQAASNPELFRILNSRIKFKMIVRLNRKSSSICFNATEKRRKPDIEFCRYV